MAENGKKPIFNTPVGEPTAPAAPAVAPRRGVESGEVDMDGGGIERFSMDNPPPITGMVMEEVAMPSKATFDLEAFMAEDVQVAFAEPKDENDHQVVELNVNGDYRLVPRDANPHTIKRYHLEVAARAKGGRVRQKKIVNPDGSMGYSEETVLALTYPFQVYHDPSGKRGSDWLKSILRRPG